MRRWIYFLGHLAIITILTSFATFSFEDKTFEVPSNLQARNEVLARVVQIQGYNKGIENPRGSVFLGKTFLGFKESLAFKESQGNYNTVNTLGYLGKYQFGANTLKLIGVNDTKLFLNNPALQEKVFELNVARNKWILRRDIKRFVGKKINGTLITESGIVAAAHLAGAGNVKKYLRSYGQMDFSDAYGTSIAYYIKKFGGYDLSKIKAIHNPKVTG